jgi:hypothetical protein
MSKIKKVTIGKGIISYATAVRGDWFIKVSVYLDEQIMIVGYNEITGDYFTRIFDSYKESIVFLEYLTLRKV